MRKYLKSKDSTDANSTIFKQAKRRFHYEPPQKENKYFLHSKHKPQNTNSNRQFKDDFSSVKEAKNDTNQINESSWIVKLVNVMHESSEEEKQLGQHQHQANNFLSLRPIESKQFQEIPKERTKSPLPTLKQQSKEATPLATKKNSFKIEMANNKKRSKSQKSQSCDTVSKRSKKHSKVQTIKRNKNEVDLKRNRSQSLIKTSDKKQDKVSSQIKSLKNIEYSKAHTQKVRVENNSIFSDNNLYSSKQFSGNLGIDSKHSSQINKQTEIRKEFVSSSSKEKIPIPQEKHFQSSICYQKIKENMLDDDIPDDLFALSTNQKSLGVKTQTQQTNQKRSYIGSIKKNKPTNLSQRKDVATKLPLYEQKQHKRRQQATIFEKKDEDIVTAREEKQLIDKYLNNDYSFKKQSNMFRNEYSTSDFDRSLLNLNKPAINLDRPLNSGKTSYRHESYMSKRQQRELIVMERPDEKFICKRQPNKKFNYLNDNGEKQTTENSMSVEILTLRCHQQQPKTVTELPNFVRPIRNERNETNQRQMDQLRYKKQEELKRIHQKYNYQGNKQNQSKIQTRKNSVIVAPTRRQNLMEVKPNAINRNPYLQQSIYKNDDHWSVQAKYSSGLMEDPAFKIEPSPPPIRQRLQSNFNIDNLHSISRRERTDSDIYSEAESENLIIRLNSKLHNYINQHNLQKQGDVPLSSREAEPTHRKMNLNFNELKKHHDFFQR